MNVDFSKIKLDIVFLAQKTNSFFRQDGYDTELKYVA